MRWSILYDCLIPIHIGSCLRISGAVNFNDRNWKGIILNGGESPDNILATRCDAPVEKADSIAHGRFGKLTKPPILFQELPWWFQIPSEASHARRIDQPGHILTWIGNWVRLVTSSVYCIIRIQYAGEVPAVHGRYYKYGGPNVKQETALVCDRVSIPDERKSPNAPHRRFRNTK